jgi:hypothetical protein
MILRWRAAHREIRGRLGLEKPVLFSRIQSRKSLVLFLALDEHTHQKLALLRKFASTGIMRP